MFEYKPVRAPRGTDISCKGWIQEAAMRMLMNNLDPEVAENPEALVVYGGSGRAARSWAAYHAIIDALRSLDNDETLLVQSGKPVGILKTTPDSPRILIANANLVPRWATWEKFWELEDRGLIMFGQMTAGSWIYIGTQGILQGTYETFAECARQHCNGSLTGKFVLTGGMGGMGGAQPLSVTMNDGIVLDVEIDPERIRRRVETGYCDMMTDNLDSALEEVKLNVETRKPKSIGLVGNAATVFAELVKRNITPDIVTDQTSAHDPLNGYIPEGLTLSEAEMLRSAQPEEYVKRAVASIVVQVDAMVEMQRRGAVVFDYGNNIRAQAYEGGYKDAFAFPGFVPAFIRPLFCEGKGPFRWAALSGDPADIRRTDELVLECFKGDEGLERWIRIAGERVTFQGLPSRICWLGFGERAKLGLRINELVASGEIKAPIVIGRDHLDCGSVASPYRETEDMKDGSDAIADWPLLNALVNTASGASWVSIHHGGGVGIGYSIHAGQVIVADGSPEAARRLKRVLDNDPGTGIIRHVDAGYSDAARNARKHGIKIPMAGSGGL